MDTCFERENNLSAQISNQIGSDISSKKSVCHNYLPSFLGS